MDAIGASQETVWQDLGGPSPATLRKILGGQEVRRDTYFQLDRALGWTEGEARRVLDGQDFARLDGGPGNQHAEDWIYVRMTSSFDPEGAAFSFINEATGQEIRARIIPEYSSDNRRVRDLERQVLETVVFTLGRSAVTQGRLCIRVVDGSTNGH